MDLYIDIYYDDHIVDSQCVHIDHNSPAAKQIRINIDEAVGGTIARPLIAKAIAKAKRAAKTAAAKQTAQKQRRFGNPS